MRSTVEPLEGNRVKLAVEVEEAEFDRAIDAAFKAIAREVRIPGFRPGKAPRRVLEARFGADVAREQALREALPEFYVDAVKEHDVDAIAPPEIEITAGQDSGPVAFDAVVEVRPQITVPGYGGLRVELPRPTAGLALIADHDGRPDSYGIELMILNLEGTPREAVAEITVTAANGQSLTFEATRATGCYGEGGVYWDGPDDSGIEAAQLGPAPFAYRVALTLDGTEYMATATWPDDEIEGNEPSVALEFSPELPALH